MTSERLEMRWERQLDEVAATVGYPATPDLGQRVLASVAGERIARRSDLDDVAVAHPAAVGDAHDAA